jgi:hypothetical protein
MGSWLDFMSDHRGGIFTLIAVVAALGGLVNWFLWMLGLGRFAGSRAPGVRPTTIRYVLTEFFVQIVNDFRHLLALLLVSLFTVTLLVAMVPPLFRPNGPDLNAMRDGLQAVAAALGGLIGSIVGYYFGESAGKRAEPAAPRVTQPVVQNVPPPGAPPTAGIQPPAPPMVAPAPPPAKGP